MCFFQAHNPFHNVNTESMPLHFSNKLSRQRQGFRDTLKEREENITQGRIRFL